MTRARTGQSDATLFALRLGCPLLETGFQLEGTFFSRTAQSFYNTGTSEAQASDAAPGTIPILDTSQGVKVSFVYRSLVRAGFDEDALLGAAGGVTIQPSTDSHAIWPALSAQGRCLLSRLRPRTGRSERCLGRHPVMAMCIATPRDDSSHTVKGKTVTSVSRIEDVIDHLVDLYAARPAALFTDFDGTLSPVAPAPDLAECRTWRDGNTGLADSSP